VEGGYTDRIVQRKLGLLACLGRWLESNKLSVTDLDEPLLETFLKRKLREDKGHLIIRTLQQFLDHLRRQTVVPARNLPPDRSPLGQILSQYETHLRTERGLVASTIQEYQSFVRDFLLEHFHGQPFLLKAVKASDISDFVLRHAPSMAAGRAQTMTSAFRSFFRFLFQGNFTTACPSLRMWAKPWPPTCVAIVLPARRVECSFARTRHAGALPNSATLSTIVRQAIARADLHPPLKGAHLLRHSLATSMLGSGAAMREIAEILRHRALSTTAIYAKVDFQGLRSLAQPWPMGGAK
jgi:site-specific recombinase XerD